MDAQRFRLVDRIYDVIEEGGPLTVRQIAIRCGMPGYTRRALVRQHVFFMVRKGCVKRVGGSAKHMSLYCTSDL